MNVVEEPKLKDTELVLDAAKEGAEFVNTTEKLTDAQVDSVLQTVTVTG